jgi:FkbH-like protein
VSEARSVDEILRDPASTAEILRAVDELDKRDAATSIPVHVLRNFTIENVLPALRFAGYRRDVRISVTLSTFDGYQMDALSSSRDLVAASAVVVWLWLDAMPMAFTPEGRLDVERAQGEILGVVDAVLERSHATVFLHTLLPPLGAGPGFDDYDALDTVNLALRARARADKRVRVVDVARMASEVGLGAAVDTRFALASSAPVSAALGRAWGEALGEELGRAVGRVKKVLVVDADDTLWGGIVGEDGAAGIRLSDKSWPGNAYHAFQRQLLSLRDRGVLLALASKNDPEAVHEILDHHPACLLKREHFAAMRVGWGPKSDAIRSMAEELKLGVDAFVFVDDSAVELAEVASGLPSVLCVRMPKEAARVPHVIGTIAAFAHLGATAEDRLRAAHYGAERVREELRARHADVDAFLASLELEAVVGPPGPDEIERVAQLTQRTNQWNLTTRRYEVVDVERMVGSDRFTLVALRAKDKFGDYGLTGVGIGRLDEDGGATIDSLLMSCRTLGRRLEEVLLGELLSAIRASAPQAEIRAEYRPTKKNALVAEVYDRFGFTRVGTDEGSTTRYVRSSTSPDLVPPSMIRIRRSP